MHAEKANKQGQAEHREANHKDAEQDGPGLRSGAQKELQRSELEENQRMLGALSAGVMHDMRAPLGALQMQAQVLQRLLEKEGVHGHHARIATIIELARQAMDMAELYLQLLRGNAPVLVPLDLHRAASQVLTMLKSTLITHQITYTLETASGAGLALADEPRCKRILFNLIDNAIRATPPGGAIRIVISGQGNTRRIAVTDTGCGMEPHILARVFDFGFTTRQTGHGVGLAACRQNAADMHGSLTAVSAPGQGSTFTLVLPACHCPPGPDHACGASPQNAR